jgi:thiamine pyrophosphate-dependent acetolactate synthase large subunit-like protein
VLFISLSVGFMMLMAEFATAVQYNLPIKVIILKNNTHGMIRWEQILIIVEARIDPFEPLMPPKAA